MNRIIFDPSYYNTITALKNVSHDRPTITWTSESEYEKEESNGDVEIDFLPHLEKIYKVKNSYLKNNNGNNGFRFSPVAAYDESILEIKLISGSIRCISHALTLNNGEKYLPTGYVTLKYFSSSKKQSEQNETTIYTEDLNREIQEHYNIEKSRFIKENAPPNSIIFIDGPMFSGLKTYFNFQLVDELFKEQSLPVFFVKNSESTILKENFSFAKDYHNDLHWAHENLQPMSRSSFFKYKSKEGRAKCFFFLKLYSNRSPIRIEVPLKLFKGLEYPENLLDTIIYQYLAGGASNNLQPQIIKVTEQYAREIIKSTNVYNQLNKMGLIKTMNEQRF